MTRIFFKLNNHKGGHHQVAYYHCCPPHDHVEWQADPEKNLAGLGEELYLCSNKFGISSDNFSQAYGHFGRPSKGDLVVIFQCVYKKTRVVTHILQFLDNQVGTFSNQFAKTHPKTVQNFLESPYYRRTRILSVLKPSTFNGIVVSGCPDLCATQNPSGAAQLDQLTDGNHSVSTGRIYENYSSHKTISEQALNKWIFQNKAYACMRPDQDIDFLSTSALLSLGLGRSAEKEHIDFTPDSHIPHSREEQSQDQEYNVDTDRVRRIKTMKHKGFTENLLHNLLRPEELGRRTGFEVQSNEKAPDERNPVQDSKQINDFQRELLVIHPQEAPRNQTFNVDVHFGAKPSDLPAINETKETGVRSAFQFFTEEKKPIIKVYARSGCFNIAKNTQTVRLGERNHEIVSFHMRLIKGFDDIDEGDLFFTFYYLHSEIAHIKLKIKMTSSVSSIINEVKKTISLTIHQNLSEIYDLFQQREIWKSKDSVLDISQLPFALQLSYREMINRPTIIEQAGSLPYVLENFLLYHINIGTKDQTILNTHRNITTGFLKNCFFSMIDGKKTKKEAFHRLPYLAKYRERLYKSAINELVKYRNSIWGHNNNGFPDEEQCQELHEPRHQDLLLLLSVTTNFKATNRLIFVNPQHQSFYLPHLSLLSPQTINFEGEGVFCWKRGEKPRKTLLSWLPCDKCGSDIHHLFLYTGNTEKPKSILGSCDYQETILLRTESNVYSKTKWIVGLIFLLLLILFVIEVVL